MPVYLRKMCFSCTEKLYSFSQLNSQGLATSSCSIYSFFFLTDFNFKWDSKNNWLVSASENVVGILNQIFCTLFRNSTVSRLSARIFYIQTGILAIWYVCKSSCLEKVFAMETASVRLTKELCTCNRDNWIVSSSLTGTQPVLCSHKCILYRA